VRLRRGSVQACDAHPGKDGNGICRAGAQLCVAGGGNSSSAFGACTGSVGPAPADSCAIIGDDADCDGVPNGGCPTSPPPPPAVSFQTDVWPIFMTNCTPCHTTRRAGGHSVGSPDLATAFADATRLNTTIIQRLDGGGMPPTCVGVPGDPGCIGVADLATIQRWIDTGMTP
jgi:hypothetical protein